MMKGLIFLAAESLLLSVALLLGWLLIAHSLRKLRVQTPASSKLAWLMLWLLVFAIDTVLTRAWGATFTAHYHLAGFILLFSLALYCLSLLLTATQKHRA